jgi:hypothetical protein
MKWLLTILVIAVLILHQDFWLWTDKTLVFGFLPIGLAYHALYSLVAAFTMWLLVRFAWPKEIEEADALLTAQAQSAAGERA